MEYEIKRLFNEAVNISNQEIKAWQHRFDNRDF